MNEKYRIIGITEDFGTGKDKSGKAFDWTGKRLIVQVLGKDSATTKIFKASADFPEDILVDDLSDYGVITCALHFDEYGRVVSYINSKG